MEFSIGYPNENPKQRPRKKLNDVLERYWYGKKRNTRIL